MALDDRSLEVKVILHVNSSAQGCIFQVHPGGGLRVAVATVLGSSLRKTSLAAPDVLQIDHFLSNISKPEAKFDPHGRNCPLRAGPDYLALALTHSASRRIIRTKC